MTVSVIGCVCVIGCVRECVKRCMRAYRGQPRFAVVVHRVSSHQSHLIRRDIGQCDREVMIGCVCDWALESVLDGVCDRVCHRVCQEVYECIRGSVAVVVHRVSGHQSHLIRRDIGQCDREVMIGCVCDWALESVLDGVCDRVCHRVCQEVYECIRGSVAVVVHRVSGHQSHLIGIIGQCDSEVMIGCVGVIGCVRDCVSGCDRGYVRGCVRECERVCHMASE